MRNLIRRVLSGFAAIASTGLLLSPISSLADTLDFSIFPVGPQGNPVLILPQATITSFGDDIYVGAHGHYEICALNGFTCNADMKISFNGAVNNLSFVTSGAEAGDHIDVSAYNGSFLLGVVGQSTDGFVDLSGFSNVTSIYIDDSSTAAGMAYDGFTFTAAAPVPEPETYAMLLAGLVLLGFAARRRKLKGVAA